MSGSNTANVSLNVSVQQANIILNALAEQPWRVVNELIIDLRGQITRQVPPRQENR